jgi:hypothetical protein
MAVGDKDEDYVELWGGTDQELASHGEVYRSIWTGYKPFVPFKKNYNMQVREEATSSATTKMGLFQFQPEGYGQPWAGGKNATPSWGAPFNEGDDFISNIAAYNAVREILDQEFANSNLSAQASDIKAASGGFIGTDAGIRAAKLAADLEKIIEIEIPKGVAGGKVIKGAESIGEIRTQGMVSFLKSDKGKSLRGSSALLRAELQEMNSIVDSFEAMGPHKEYGAGAFSKKGFDIGHYSDADIQTTSYLIQRFSKEFPLAHSEKIVGMEETNMGGHKLFQTLDGQNRVYQTSKETVQRDLQTEMDKTMGKVERFIQEVSESNLDKGEMLSLQREMMKKHEMGGNQFVLDSPVLLTEEMWESIYRVKGGTGHETLTSFSAQVVDRLYRAYNDNVTRNIENPEMGSGYMYIVPVTIKYPDVNKTQTSLVAVHIFGHFEKVSDGLKLVDIQNRVYNLGVYDRADAAMLDTWMQEDLRLNMKVGTQVLKRAMYEYRDFIGREIQMFYGSTEAIGTQVLMTTELGASGLKGTVSFVATMTAAEMAKSFQEQLEAQLSSNKVSAEFKKFYDKMTEDADELTVAWKAAVGVEGISFTDAFGEKPTIGAFVNKNAKDYGLKSGFVWPDRNGITGSGGFTNKSTGAMEGFAFTPFVDTTSDNKFYKHSRAAVYPSRNIGLKKAIAKLKKKRSEEAIKRPQTASVLAGMGLERIGGQSQFPLMRILWRNGRLTDVLGTEREAMIDRAMADLMEAKFGNNPELRR